MAIVIIGSLVAFADCEQSCENQDPVHNCDETFDGACNRGPALDNDHALAQENGQLPASDPAAEMQPNNAPRAARPRT